MEKDDGKSTDDRWRAQLTQALAAYSLAVPLANVTGRSRDARSSMARMAAMYLARVTFGMSTGRVGSAFGCDRSTVSHACRTVEDRRDEPHFDRWMNALEQSVEAAPAPFRGRAA